MTRKCTVLFCENEHGTGDVTFPAPQSDHEFQQWAINCPSTGELRKQAKAKGWGRVNGGDFCPGCMESM